MGRRESAETSTGDGRASCERLAAAPSPPLSNDNESLYANYELNATLARARVRALSRSRSRIHTSHAYLRLDKAEADFEEVAACEAAAAAGFGGESSTIRRACAAVESGLYT